MRLSILASLIGVSLFALTDIAHGSDIADAAQRGDNAAVRALIAEQAAVDEPQTDGSTALHWAVQSGDLETARLLIRAGMCFTFLVAKGFEVGRSLVQDDMVGIVRGLMDGSNGHKIILPVDIATGTEFSENAARHVVAASEIPVDSIGLDIGAETGAGFWELIASSQNVFWNGPMGVFEWEQFRNGTEQVARALAACDGFTAVGGGDSAAALRLLGLENSVSHLSTGGGAGLELLEGRVLPGVAVLERWVL